ncbi:hypothetical protein [Actinoplanes sp. N902-109]|uniref:hypothetical protein n=1 Tax=Actinoplanes sp. (strain N902-109) TaxID=649831 RepID=UPI0003295B0A|nr:hypothetical protein [Actinoplanes sp. N902-109]AGL14386.1 hypothetical protein L083_0876 [Actinoplanes sp. N902-109]
MSDQLEELFTGLRTDTLPQVQPPGVDAARTTVRRRRTTRHAAAATALVAAVGGTAVIGWTGRGGQHENRPADRSAHRAVAGLGDRTAGGLVGESLPATFTDVQAGGYTLAVACAGRGVLTVRLELRREAANPQDLGGQVVSCAADPQPASIMVRVPAPGVLSASINGDDQARDGASYAMALRHDEESDPSTQASQETVWNTSRAIDLLTGSSSAEVQSITTEEGSQILTTAAGEGEYLLRTACAGPGAVSFKMETLPARNGKPDAIGETLIEETIDCIDVDPHADGGLTTVWLPAHSGYVVTVTPDEAARNRAGVAWVLEPQ